jgi:D-sedoheptulose 7-phosphate isomerase
MGFAAHFEEIAIQQQKVCVGFAAAYGSACDALIDTIIAQLRLGKKILFAGNGGSACDAMHIAGEFVGRYKRERSGMAAIALSADTGIITAVGNDYGYAHIFARQIEALGHQGDIFIALSTSGKSPNILAACDAATNKGLHCALFTGAKGRDADVAAQRFIYESVDTAIIQQCTMATLHLIADKVEEHMVTL